MKTARCGARGKCAFDFTKDLNSFCKRQFNICQKYGTFEENQKTSTSLFFKGMTRIELRF